MHNQANIGFIKKWRLWFKDQPWGFRWFLWIILLRPFIDALWFVKDLGILSPLQIVGFLTIVLSIIYSLKIKSSKQGLIPFSFILFSTLLILNQSLLLVESMDMKTIAFVLRTIAPVAILIYLSRVITSIDRFHGILNTFLISSIFPLGLLFYETIFSPINYVPLPESRGGGFRLTGLYADLFSYMSYVIGDLLVLIYFGLFTIRNYGKKVKYKYILLVLGLGVVALLGLKHQASWAVFGMLILSLLYYVSKIQRGGRYLVFLFGMLILSSPILIDQQLKALYSKEISVYNEGGSKDRAFNGRINRWKRYFVQWEEISIVSKLTGVGTSSLDFKSKKNMTSGGMHSDYVRLLFGAGIIGLLSIIIFYGQIFIKGRKMLLPEAFYICTAIFILLMYSITSNPFGSSGSLMYLLFVGIVIALQSKNEFYGLNDQTNDNNYNK